MQEKLPRETFPKDEQTLWETPFLGEESMRTVGVLMTYGESPVYNF